MKTLSLITVLLVGSLVGCFAKASDINRFAYPDYKQPNCVATPAELARHKEAWAAVGTFGGLDYVVGTWELVKVPFTSATISFSYNEHGFFVQNEDDVPTQASLCATKNTKNEIMLRVSMHKPGCPENRNIFVRSKGLNEMSVTSYRSRVLGSVTFERTSATPQPKGASKGKAKCASEDEEK